MVTCSLCGKEDLCFTCPYCNGVYCGEHRLPESHGCPGLQQVKDDARRKIAQSFSGQYDSGEEEKKTYRRKKRTKRSRRVGKFSSQEIRDLGIAMILVILVSIAINGVNVIDGFLTFFTLLLSPFWWVPVTMLALFMSAFFLHEMAHKFTAQYYGMWSEFRMVTQGYYLSAIAILFSLPIFGTGIVFTSGSSSLEEDGKTNLAGPLSNFLFAVALALIGISAILLGGTLDIYTLFVLRTGITLNAVLGLFNMIPFQPFDGGTIFKWNRVLWVILALSMLFLLLFAWFILPFL